MAQSQFENQHDKQFFNSKADNPMEGMAPQLHPDELRLNTLTSPVNDDQGVSIDGVNVTEDDGSALDPSSMDPSDPLYQQALAQQSDAALDPTLQQIPFAENLAPALSDECLRELGQDLLADIEADISSRASWSKQLKLGIKELGLSLEHKTEPWDGSASVTHSMLLETVVRFQAEAVQETFNANGPCRVLPESAPTSQVLEAAQRIAADINTLMTGGIPGFRTEHERMLFTLGLCGVAAKHIEYDPTKQMLVDHCVPANDLIMPWDTSHLSTTERYAVRLRLSPTQYDRLCESGFYNDEHAGYGPDDKKAGGRGETETDDSRSGGSVEDDLDDEIMRVVGFDYTAEDDGRVVVYQVDVERVIEEYDPGKCYPWLVTIRARDGQVLSVYRNWREGDATATRRRYAAKYGLMPAFGAYDLGYAHLLLSSNVAATDILRQLIDAGSLANLPAGYKTRGLRVKGDNTPLSPGELRDVDVASGTLRDNIVTGIFKEPSQTLYNLLGTVVEEGRRVGSVADLKLADISSQAPVGTTLAMLERSLKPMSAIQGRMYDALADEINLLRTMLADYIQPLMEGPLKTLLTAQPQDYAVAERVRIVPTLDPVSGTMTQRIAQFQSAYQLSQGAPDIYDKRFLHRQMLTTLGLSNVEQIIPDPTQQAPMDPVAENMALINGKPVQAFEQQDHDSHITIHMALKNDPMMAQMIGQSPQAQAIVAASDAHLRQHVAYSYKRRMEQMLGQPLPEQQTQQLDQQLTPMIAQAADKLLQHDMQQAAAEAAKANAQDPVLQAQAQAQQNAARKLDLEDQHHDDEMTLELLKLAASLHNDQQTLDMSKAQTLLSALIDKRTADAKERDTAAKLQLAQQKQDNQATRGNA